MHSRMPTWIGKKGPRGRKNIVTREVKIYKLRKLNGDYALSDALNVSPTTRLLIIPRLPKIRSSRMRNRGVMRLGTHGSSRPLGLVRRPFHTGFIQVKLVIFEISLGGSLG